MTSRGRPKQPTDDVMQPATRVLGSDGEEWLEAQRPVEASRRGAADATAGADTTPVTAIMSKVTIAVRPDVSVESVVAFFQERGISGAPVVDDQCKLVGVVSKSDLLRSGWDEDCWDTEPVRARGRRGIEYDLGEGYHAERLPRATVAEVMTPFALTLPASASIARAAALMAYEGIHRVIVVSSDGAILGIVTTLDVARWIARHEGYQLPTYTQRQRHVAGFVAISAKESDSSQPGPARGRHSILVVEDDADTREDVARLLRDQGYDVVTASNGAEAIAVVRAEGPPRLILLDLRMPVMDGWSFRSELLKDPKLATVPVILLSGTGNVRQEAASLGAAGYLSKPIGFDALLDAAQRYCS